MTSVRRRAFDALIAILRKSLERLVAYDVGRFTAPPTHSTNPPAVSRLLVTGAAGGVATLIRPYLRERYDTIILSDCVPIADLAAHEVFIAADLRDRGALDTAVAGVDAILHLGAASLEAPFADLVGPNVVGVVNVLEAARAAGVGRVVLASTMHVLGMYTRYEQVDVTSVARPDSRYAVTKLFAEQMARVFAEKWNMRIACIRIGHVMREQLTADPGNWISPRDLAALCFMAIEHPDIRFEIFHGVADYDGDDRGQPGTARRFGYSAQDRGGSYADALSYMERYYEHDPTARIYRGGSFASSEWEPS